MDQEWKSNSALVRIDDMVTGLVTKNIVVTQAAPSSQIEENNAESYIDPSKRLFSSIYAQRLKPSSRITW